MGLVNAHHVSALRLDDRYEYEVMKTNISNSLCPYPEGWGIGNKKPTARACAEACTAHRPGPPNYGVFANLPCNAWARGDLQNTHCTDTVFQRTESARLYECLPWRKVMLRYRFECLFSMTLLPGMVPAGTPGRGVLEKKHSTHVESPPPPSSSVRLLYGHSHSR